MQFSVQYGFEWFYRWFSVFGNCVTAARRTLFCLKSKGKKSCSMIWDPICFNTKMIVTAWPFTVIGKEIWMTMYKIVCDFQLNPLSYSRLCVKCGFQTKCILLSPSDSTPRCVKSASTLFAFIQLNGPITAPAISEPSLLSFEEPAHHFNKKSALLGNFQVSV